MHSFWRVVVLVVSCVAVGGGAAGAQKAAHRAPTHEAAGANVLAERINAVLADPVFVLKRELLRLPFIGWYLSASGQIAIDRAAGMKALAAMARAARGALDAGRQVIVFPEGHRQPPGVTGTYLPGVAILYGEGGAPIIPVALNSGLFWGRNAFLRRPGRIVMEILPPMPPGIDRRSFVNELRARIETATRKLEAEALARFAHLPRPAAKEG